MGEEASERETNILMSAADAAYTLWESGRNRYLVTPGRKDFPVLGYVSQNADELWIIERAGKILPTGTP